MPVARWCEKEPHSSSPRSCLFHFHIGQIDDAQRVARSAQEDCDIEKAKAKAIADQARKEALSLRKALDEAISRYVYVYTYTSFLLCLLHRSISLFRAHTYTQAAFQ